MSSATETAIVIRLPLPRELLPNNRSNAHWAAHAKNARQWRFFAWSRTYRQLDGTCTQWPAARLDIEWRCAGKQPDRFNVSAACKHIIDGIADTGIVSDDALFEPGTVTVTRVKRADEELVLTLTRQEAT